VTLRRFVAAWFGSGLVLRLLRGSDAGSGTVGAVVALVPALLLARFGWVVQVVAAVVVVAVSLWAAAPFARDDPGWVVVDEAAGTFVAVIGLSGWAVAVAFVVFRVADATKRFPGVGPAERLPGTWGVTSDDLVAGLYGLGAGWALVGLA